MDNTNSRKVMVRNAEGRLVRAVPQKLRAIHQADGSSNVIVKEIDVPALRKPLDEALQGAKIRADWKKPKKSAEKRPSVTSADASLQPLLQSADIEQGLQSSTQAKEGDSGTQSQNTSAPKLVAPGSTSHESIRYALLPGQSVQSLFGEDDGVIPEDVAASSNMISMDQPAQDGEVDASKKLYVRPLPEDASSERTVKLPERVGSRGSASGPQNLVSYGSVNKA